MSQAHGIPCIQETKAGEAEDFQEGPPPSTGGNMAVYTGAGTLSFVLLLCCWEEARPWPTRMYSEESEGDWQIKSPGPESGR
jgi:hypothetical protein